MLLSLIRRIAWSDSEVQAGMWKREENRGTELEGKTIGIIGFGHTGRAFAKKLMGFDMRILVYDKYSNDAVPSYVERVDALEQIYAQAEVVSFHVPLHADTLGYFNDAFIACMQKPFILVNTSRGKVVDTAALKRGIERGRVVGACLDVIEQEPLESMNAGLRSVVDELVRKNNVIITPHIAGYTHEALYKMSATLLQKIAGL
jgi:D-3-phosphoglycerate dehydrogenase